MYFEKWYNRYREYFPDEDKNEIDRNADGLHFYLHVYQGIVMNELPPLLRNLMLEQYPVFLKETRKRVLNEIDSIAITTGMEFLFKMCAVIKDQHAGVNFREKYPKFQEWIDFYGAPPQPMKMKDEERYEAYQYEKFTDEEWEALKASEDAISLMHHNWEEKRKTQFYDILQPLVFKYWPELPEEMDADAWILYAVNIRDEYDYFETLCGRMQTFIDYNFPEEYLDLNNEEYGRKKYEAFTKVEKWKLDLHKRRVAGERI